MNLAPPRLAAEQVKISAQIDEIETQLGEVRKQRAQLEDNSPEISIARHRLGEVYRYMGRVEQALVTLETADDSSDLSAQIRELKNRLTEILQRVDAQGRRQRTTAALERVSRTIQYYANELQLERREDTAQLNVDDLSLTFVDKAGESDFLWEIGSGENWMGYHIALMLALHEYFQKDAAGSPVLSFLLIDQPTQVYFPARDDSYDALLAEKKAGAELDVRKASDLSRARRIFSTLSTAVDRTRGALQIIVTDHADEATWGGLPNVYLVGNWRGDEYLVPTDWEATPRT